MGESKVATGMNWQSGCSIVFAMRSILAYVVFLWTAATAIASPPLSGSASWYGQERQGQLMANGKPFDPDKLTAASWFFPLGTVIRVSAVGSTNYVEVTITDRGPSRALVRQGRIIDLSRSAFQRLADPDRGVIDVCIQQ